MRRLPPTRFRPRRWVGGWVDGCASVLSFLLHSIRSTHVRTLAPRARAEEEEERVLGLAGGSSRVLVKRLHQPLALVDGHGAVQPEDGPLLVLRHLLQHVELLLGWVGGWVGGSLSSFDYG